MGKNPLVGTRPQETLNNARCALLFVGESAQALQHGLSQDASFGLNLTLQAIADAMDSASEQIADSIRDAKAP